MWARSTRRGWESRPTSERLRSGTGALPSKAMPLPPSTSELCTRTASACRGIPRRRRSGIAVRQGPARWPSMSVRGPAGTTFVSSRTNWIRCGASCARSRMNSSKSSKALKRRAGASPSAKTKLRRHGRSWCGFDASGRSFKAEAKPPPPGWTRSNGQSRNPRRARAVRSARRATSRRA